MRRRGLKCKSFGLIFLIITIIKINILFLNKDKYLFQCGFKKDFMPWMAKKSLFYLGVPNGFGTRMSRK
jgi:hypothetical protein